MATTISLYLIDDDMTGRVKCKIEQRTTVLYKIPRSDLEKCNSSSNPNSDISKHLKQTGIYFLLGKDEESGKDAIYIGQASLRKNDEALLFRLNEHKRNPDKDYFTEAIAITTTDDTLDATKLNYLENRFTNLAKEAKRFIVKNKMDPSIGNYSEETESSLNEFIDNVKLIMGTLGYRPFTPLLSDMENEVDTGEILSYKGTSFDAMGKVTDEGFVLMKGSKISNTSENKVKDYVKRARLEHANVIDSNWIITEDILFSSPSGAACFVKNGSRNGKDVWKDQRGFSLNDIENEKEGNKNGKSKN